LAHPQIEQGYMLSLLEKRDLSELKSRADIRDVWAALGGAPLRHGRGRAFWRDGHNYSVSVDAVRGLWHDFVSSQGGDSLELVRVVRGCGFREALGWLADFAGVPSAARCQAAADHAWADDLQLARYFSRAVRILCEWALESLPAAHAERLNLTDLLRRVSMSDAALVTEYRAWRTRNARWTAALVNAGRRSETRIQLRLAGWILRCANG
jgi:hypothetical protein